MQLDNPAPTAQAIWDWKANIKAAYDLLTVEKHNSVISNLNSAWNIIQDYETPNDIITISEKVDGSITYKHARSSHFTHNTDTYFSNLPDGLSHSLIEACWIKTYNGIATENGSRHYYYLTPAREGAGNRLPPKWEISDHSIWRDKDKNIHYNYYVRDVGERVTP